MPEVDKIQNPKTIFIVTLAQFSNLTATYGKFNY